MARAKKVLDRVATVDCETDPFDGVNDNIQPFIWGFYDGNVYEQFDTTLELIVYLIDKPIIVYAHNGGKFDWHFLFDFIDHGTVMKIITGRIVKFKIGKCEFRDSYSILPTALRNLMKDDFDYALCDKDKRDIPENRKKIEKYLYSDCHNLYTFVYEFIARYGLTLTLAGAALKQWEKIRGKKVAQDDGTLYHNFKRYYYGGRCESHVHGVIEEKFDMVDINSAYARAMLETHPIGLDPLSITADEFWSLDEAVQGTCFITVTTTSSGALPFRGDDKSLYCPNDRVTRDYECTGWELLAALDTKTIGPFVIKECYYFPEQESFAPYVNHFYEARKVAKSVGDKPGDVFCKMFLTNLYGKFGANPDEYHNYKIFDEKYVDDDGTCGKWGYAGRMGSWALMQKELLDVEKNFYNVATAASITGWVRAYMWRAMCNCEGLLYNDTDSIAALKIGELPGGMGPELGQWEYDGHFVEGAFGGRKMYAMEHAEPVVKKDGTIETHKIAHKGVGKLTVDELYTIANGGEVKYHPQAPSFSVHKPPTFVARTVKKRVKILNT